MLSHGIASPAECDTDRQSKLQGQFNLLKDDINMFKEGKQFSNTSENCLILRKAFHNTLIGWVAITGR